MRYLLVPVLAVGLVVGTACDDDTDEDVQEDAEDVLGQGAARSVAEALRGAMLADDSEDFRSVTVIRENLEDLPGDPEVVGIDDADGDGLDDDGRIEVRVEDQAACVVLERGEIAVENGTCS